MVQTLWLRKAFSVIANVYLCIVKGADTACAYLCCPLLESLFGMKFTFDLRDHRDWQNVANDIGWYHIDDMGLYSVEYSVD